MLWFLTRQRPIFFVIAIVYQNKASFSIGERTTQCIHMREHSNKYTEVRGIPPLKATLNEVSELRPSGSPRRFFLQTFSPGDLTLNHPPFISKMIVHWLLRDFRLKYSNSRAYSDDNHGSTHPLEPALETDQSLPSSRLDPNLLSSIPCADQNESYSDRHYCQLISRTFQIHKDLLGMNILFFKYLCTYIERAEFGHYD